jgi:hypothetical protein
MQQLPRIAADLERQHQLPRSRSVANAAIYGQEAIHAHVSDRLTWHPVG